MKKRLDDRVKLLTTVSKPPNLTLQEFEAGGCVVRGSAVALDDLIGGCVVRGSAERRGGWAGEGDRRGRARGRASKGARHSERVRGRVCRAMEETPRREE